MKPRLYRRGHQASGGWGKEGGLTHTAQRAIPTRWKRSAFLWQRVDRKWLSHGSQWVTWQLPVRIPEGSWAPWLTAVPPGGIHELPAHLSQKQEKKKTLPWYVSVLQLKD